MHQNNYNTHPPLSPVTFHCIIKPAPPNGYLNIKHSSINEKDCRKQFNLYMTAEKFSIYKCNASLMQDFVELGKHEPIRTLKWWIKTLIMYQIKIFPDTERQYKFLWKPATTERLTPCFSSLKANESILQNHRNCRSIYSKMKTCQKLVHTKVFPE